jgi:hypothetical protein
MENFQSTTRSMKLMRKPEPWMCQITSWAMACQTDVSRLIELIGHDGSEVINNKSEPHNRRGHHSQECVVAAIGLGFYATHVSALPGYDTFDTVKPVEHFGRPSVEFYMNLVRTKTGVVNVRNGGNAHAMAFCEGFIYDPDGYVWDINQMIRMFTPYCLWVVGNA